MLCFSLINGKIGNTTIDIHKIKVSLTDDTVESVLNFSYEYFREIEPILKYKWIRGSDGFSFSSKEKTGGKEGRNRFTLSH